MPFKPIAVFPTKNSNLHISAFSKKQEAKAALRPRLDEHERKTCKVRKTRT